MEQFKNIQEQFNQVIAYSQGYDGKDIVNTDELFNEWYKNKKWIIDAMGGNLIYEYPEEVAFELTEEERDKKLSKFIDYVYDRCYSLGSFLNSTREDFFTNTLNKEYVYESSAKTIKIESGAKIVKSFKHFTTDTKLLERLQTKASMLIQGNKVKGRFCISVHPLDFISSSENNHNWRSCHSLDGCYRTGNLSYLVDSSTIICYLKSDDDTILPCFPRDVPWNNKKWRMWLFISNDKKMMFAGRQYPFEISATLKFLTELFNSDNNFELYATVKYWNEAKRNKAFGWTDWQNDSISHFFGAHGGFRNIEDKQYFPVDDGLLSNQILIKNAENSKHYNDLLCSSTYTKPYYCYLRRAWYYDTVEANLQTRFILGGAVKCLCCGRETLAATDSMVCFECDLQHGTLDSEIFGHCACCNRRVVIEDSYFLDDTLYCPACARKNENYVQCETCGAWVSRETAQLGPDDNYYCEFCEPPILAF